MSGLQAMTGRGSEMVAAAARFANEFADRALECDRTATFARDHLDKLRVDEPAPQALPRPRTTARREGGSRRAQSVRNDGASSDDHQHRRHLPGRGGTERYGFAHVPSDAPGVLFHDDWDAIGMRASDSGSVSFNGLRLPADGVRDGFAPGEPSAPLFDIYLASDAFHASASLGIAESAHHRLLATLATRGNAIVEDAFAMSNLADNVVDLMAMQASLDCAGRRVDDYLAARPDLGRRALAHPPTCDGPAGIRDREQRDRSITRRTSRNPVTGR